MTHTRLQMIQRFSTEKELREEILMPLFQKMGFEVILNHGSNEFGKDILLCKTDEFGERRYSGLIVKKGSINKSQKSETTHLLGDIARQVREAYEIDYCDLSTKTQVKINNAYVICDGNISDNARTSITKQWGASMNLYEKNTWFFSSDKLIELIHNYWPVFFETYSPDYNEFAEKQKENLDREEKVRAIKIDEQIYQISRSQIKATLVEFCKTKDKRYKQIPRNIDTVFENEKHILIVGESGSGKSQILRDKIRSELITETEKGNDPRIKFYMKMSDLSTIDINSSCLNKVIGDYVKVIWKDVPTDYHIQFIDSGRIDFYFDGYDEIPTEEKRVIARSSIIYLLKTFTSSQFVITTREISAIFNQDFPESFKRYNLLQLDYKQSVKCLESIVNEAAKNCKDLLQQIKQQEILLILPRTPLTMQLISSLFSQDSAKEIPSNTTEVYKIFTELMLGRWDKQRDVTNIFDYEQKITILSEIAYIMQCEYNDKIDYERAIRLSEEFLDGYGDDKKLGKQLIDEIIARSELFAIEGQHLRFKHRSFQEFFCAHKIQTQALDFRQHANDVANPWWDNVIIFLCGFRKRANDIVSHVVNIDCSGASDEDLFRFRRGKALGLMVRAGYQTTNEYKEMALKGSIDDYSYCYDSEELSERIRKIVRRKPSKYSIHIALQLVLSNAYYSKLMQKTIYDFIDQCVDGKQISFLLKLVSDYKDINYFDSALSKIREHNNLEINKACKYIAQDFQKNGDSKILESKEFRKLNKYLRQISRPGDKKRRLT